MRRLLIAIVAATAVAFGTMGCGSPAMTQDQQLADFSADLRHLGYAFSGTPEVETSTESKEKSKYNKKKKKWEKVKGKVNETEFEAAFKLAGCKFEADRAPGQTATTKVNGRDIEHFTVELEDSGDELEFDLLAAHTPQQAVDLVKEALNQPQNFFTKPACFTGRV